MNTSQESYILYGPHDGPLRDNRLLLQMLGGLPHSVQIYAPDGTLLFVNRTFLDIFEISDPAKLIGHYNIFRDPTVGIELLEKIKLAFTGVTVTIRDVRIPVHNIKRVFNLPTICLETLYQDIQSYPLFDENGNLLYIVNVMILKHVYTEREEISSAIRYIDTNWKEEFRVSDAARQVNLSPAYFSRLFKKLMGISPHDYYIGIKIEHLKKKLLNTNITIEEAFSECGVNYHSYYASLFKKKTGFSPSEFRKSARRDQ